jgi:hypothetical protein
MPRRSDGSRPNGTAAAAAIETLPVPHDHRERRRQQAPLWSKTRPMRRWRMPRRSCDSNRGDPRGLPPRERRAGLQASRGRGRDTRQLRVEIGERLGIGPAAWHACPGERRRNLTDLAAQLDRLMRERNGIRPVNLLAAREQPRSNPSRLRARAHRFDGVAQLVVNRGARSDASAHRLRRAERFTFRPAFERLFDGRRPNRLERRADPLDAGLDTASPPGKRLASPLSGSE